VTPILFLVMTNVGLNGSSGRMLKFSVLISSDCFSVAIFMGSEFLYMVHFLPTFNLYLLQHSATNNNSRFDPLRLSFVIGRVLYIAEFYI